jgi:hypothetical protein
MWSEYYEKHFGLQDGTQNESGEEWTMCTQTAEPYVEPKNERAFFFCTGWDLSF